MICRALDLDHQHVCAHIAIPEKVTCDAHTPSIVCGIGMPCAAMPILLHAA